MSGEGKAVELEKKGGIDEAKTTSRMGDGAMGRAGEKSKEGRKKSDLQGVPAAEGLASDPTTMVRPSSPSFMRPL